MKEKEDETEKSVEEIMVKKMQEAEQNLTE